MIKKTDDYLDQIKEISDNKNIFIGNSPFTNTLVYLDNNKVLGFLIYDVIYEKVEIVYIFTRKDCRNKHIASDLLNKLIIEVSDKDNITLEVSVENIKALNLYKKFGFVEIAKREKYYNDVDGILMEKKLNDHI